MKENRVSPNFAKRLSKELHPEITPVGEVMSVEESEVLRDVGMMQANKPVFIHGEEREGELEGVNYSYVYDCPNPNKVELKEASEETKNAVYSCYGNYQGIINCQDCGDKEKCIAISETKDDLNGLVDHEPTWTAQEETETTEVFEKVMDNIISNSRPPIKQKWAALTEELKVIKQMYIDDAERNFDKSLRVVMSEIWS